MGRLLARLFVALRWALLAGGLALAAWVLIALPALEGSAYSGALEGLLPPSSQALRAQRISAERFAFPLSSSAMIVVRDPHGISAAREAQIVNVAAKLSLSRPQRYRGLAAAVPLPNALGSPPLSRHPGTTTLVYLYFESWVSEAAQTAIARRIARDEIGHRQGEQIGVTGIAPATTRQNTLISKHLLWVELATIALIAIAVGVHFRALGAGLLTVATVLIGYLVAERVVSEVGRRGGITLPIEISPMLIVVVFGVSTDYSIFFIHRFRALLSEGVERRDAAARLVREITPIVFVAGVTVAAGTSALIIAKLEFVRAFGPGLAIAVACAMLVVATVLPAALAIGGRRLFWPARLQGKGPASQRQDRPPRLSPTRLAARHPVMGVAVAVAVVAGASSGLFQLAIGDQSITGLPASSEPRRSFEAATRGFVPGMLAPAVLVVTGRGVGGQRGALSRLEAELSRQRGVAYALGPGRSLLADRLGIGVSSSQDAARYLVAFRHDPLEARAIAEAGRLQERLPRLVREAGMRSASGMLGGESAVSAEIVGTTLNDLSRVAPVALGAIFLILALYLRALVAPAYLILTSALGVLAALGLTVYVMQDLLGYGSLTYYVIFTVAVLLVSLGSDYNVFMVGRIWQQGKRRSLGEAVELASARAARPISTAGLVLALNFALLAIVPLRPFREIAFAMAAGLLIDAFFVRTILVPALLTLVGPVSAWPSRTLSKGPD